MYPYCHLCHRKAECELYSHRVLMPARQRKQWAKWASCMEPLLVLWDARLALIK